jgi:hypothetical protein
MMAGFALLSEIALPESCSLSNRKLKLFLIINHGNHNFPCGTARNRIYRLVEALLQFPLISANTINSNQPPG